MKNKFIDSYMNIIMNNKSNLNSEEIEKLKYAIEGIYLTITKLVIILILGIILNILKEILIVLLFYNLLRYFGFGYHAKGSKECLIISSLFFVLFPYIICQNISLTSYKIPIFVVCAVNFLLFAPSDTKKRPMVNKKKKLKRKILTLLVTFIYFIVCSFIEQKTASLIILATVIEAIMVNPIMYKITGQPYNNYKNYLSKN